MPLLAAFGVMIVLYGVGYFFNIAVLQLHISLDYTEVSLLPIVGGFAAGFVCEGVLRYRRRVKSV